MDKPRVGFPWPPSPQSTVAGSVVLDDSSWSVVASGQCSVRSDSRGGMTFFPEMKVEIHLGGRTVWVLPPQSHSMMSLLSPDPDGWEKAVDECVQVILHELSLRLIPDSRGAVGEIRGILRKARIKAIVSSISAQAHHLISVIPSCDAVSAWNEAEAAMVMSG